MSNQTRNAFHFKVTYGLVSNKKDKTKQFELFLFNTLKINRFMIVLDDDG